MQIVTKTPTTLMTTPTPTAVPTAACMAAPTPMAMFVASDTAANTPVAMLTPTTTFTTTSSTAGAIGAPLVPVINDPHSVTPIGKHIETLRGFVGLAINDAVVEAALKGYLDVMALDAAYLNAAALSLSNDLVASDACVGLLTQQLAVRDREVLVLRRALALAHEEATGHAAKPVVSDTTTESDHNGMPRAKNSVAGDYSSVDASALDGNVKDDAVDAEDPGELVNYKRRCAVLQAFLDDQKKHHARAMGEALQRSMALETLLAQARAELVATVAASAGAGGQAQEDTVHWTTTSTTTPCEPATPPAATPAPATAPRALQSTQAASATQVVSIPQEEPSCSTAAAPPAVVEPTHVPVLQTPRRIVAPKIIVPASLLRGVSRASPRADSATPPVRGLLWPGWVQANASPSATERTVAPTPTPAQPRTRLAAPQPDAAAQATAATPATAASNTTTQQQNKNKNKKATATAAAPKAKQTKASVVQRRPRWH